MIIQDLGEVAEPILCFGGTYSNAQATQAVLDWAARRNITRLLHTGDVMAYCAQPRETLRHIRNSGATVIKGNCEIQLSQNAPDCGCGFGDGTTCDLLSVAWYAYAQSQVTDTDRDWMGSCPDWVTFSQAGKRFVVIHGGATDVAQFIFSCDDASVFRAELAAITNHTGPVNGVICGHSGLAFARQIDGVHWINAGAVGMPPNDGDPRTEFAVLSNGAVTFHRLAYDHDSAAQMMDQAGLTHGYHTALRDGYWPSEDVLPPQLRRDSG